MSAFWVVAEIEPEGNQSTGKLNDYRLYFSGGCKFAVALRFHRHSRHTVTLAGFGFKSSPKIQFERCEISLETIVVTA